VSLHCKKKLKLFVHFVFIRRQWDCLSDFNIYFSPRLLAEPFTMFRKPWLGNTGIQTTLCGVWPGNRRSIPCRGSD